MSAPASGFASGHRTRVRRKDRVQQAPQAALAVVDEALICHVAFTGMTEPPKVPVSSSSALQSGAPAQCLPMAHARVGETIYLHGACSNRMLRSLVGRPCSLTFTLLDGLVFARSAFHHSMNYRSVVVFSTPEVVSDEREKYLALEAFTEKVQPGRWNDVRKPDARE